MYVISNKQLKDIKKYISALKDLPQTDNETINLKRRAGITLKQLSKAKSISLTSIKNIQNEENH